MIVRHPTTGELYGRLETLRHNVRNPSPAMRDWINTDERWHAAFDELSMSGGASCADCSTYADNETRTER